MGTRCNVKITSFGKSPTYLYRHWDGYPAETGKHIVTELRKFESCNAMSGHIYERDNPLGQSMLANRFLSDFEEKTEFREARPRYEITDGPHGDIAHFYEIQLRDGGDVLIGWAGNGKGTGNSEESVTYFTVPEFIGIINQDIDRINASLADRKRENPKEYADSEFYPKFE